MGLRSKTNSTKSKH